MRDTWELLLLSAAYVSLLFAVAYLGDRRVRAGQAPARKPWVYSLALCVYCTSGTFYGSIGRAATGGWDFLPLYIGPAMVFLFGGPLLARAIRITKRHNITSIADFVGARYGRHRPVAMLITTIAVVGVVPYIAQQLKAISFGFEVLVGASTSNWQLVDSQLTITVLLTGFAILFGTRVLVRTENHHGMVLAIAFESLVKLMAFVAVGLYVVYGLRDGLQDAYRHAMRLPQLASALAHPAWHAGLVTQTALAACAVVCLPRQFHVAFVENTAESDLKSARWIFPLFVAAISLFVVPIAAAGLEQFAGAQVAGDTFVLEVPLAGGQSLLTLGAFLGGFSAASGMVIVETIALSTMICNEIVMPLLLRSRRFGNAPGQDLSHLVKTVRRVAIVAIIGLAYLYFRLFTARGSLIEIGLLSFAAVAQFAPSLIGGVVWRGGRQAGVVAGLLIGFLVWAYTLLLPAVLIAGNDGLNLLRDGPFGIEALRPQALLGSGGLDPLTHGVLWSLALNLLFFIGVSVLRSPGLRERLQAARFLEDAGGAAAPPRAVAPGSATVGDLQELVLRFLGPVRAAEVFAEYGARAGRALRDRGEQVDPELAQFVEHVLSGVLGTSSARLVLGTTLRGRNMSPEDVVRLLDETSHAIQFGRELLRAALENLSQGVSIVDANLRLVGWNRRYQELFAYPPGLLVVGRSIEELLRFNATRGWLVSADVEAAVARRLDHMRAGRPYLHERQIAGGTVLQIQGNPMPGGGFVTSYSDITEYKRAQQALLEANETLEVRVLERTQALTRLNAELEAARISAERANEAKTRFLATATHDLVQPTTAARLFLSSLQTADLSGGSAAAVARAEAALAAGENLLSGLLDISRLDAGAERARIEVFPLLQVVGSLADEFAVIAQDRGLGFRTINCNHVIVSDPQLLRRLLQNLLSNAIRYTRRGRVVLGCRRRGGRLRIEVWDSGRGIPEDKRGEIFEEFRRIDEPDDGQERGLGLGLAIVDRIARILGHPLELRSWPGRGSAFSIEVPLGDPAAVTWSGTSAGFVPGDGLHGRCVLCLENEAAVLAAMDALLTSWGCRTVPMRDFDAAIAWVRQSASAPDLLLVDYHLDGARSGIELVQQVRDYCGRRIPGIVATADHTLAAQTAARALGCQVVRKPIKPASLRAVMSRLLP